MDAVLAGILGGKLNKPTLIEAGESLDIGDLVSNSGGKLLKPAPRTKLTMASEYEDNSSFSSAPTKFLRMDETHYFAYNSTIAFIVEISGDTITYGPSYTLPAIPNDAIAVDGSRVLTVHYDNYTIKGRIVSVLGNLITGVTNEQDVYLSTSGLKYPKLARWVDGKALLIMGTSSSTYYNIIVPRLTVAGTTISRSSVSGIRKDYIPSGALDVSYYGDKLVYVAQGRYTDVYKTELRSYSGALTDNLLAGPQQDLPMNNIENISLIHSSENEMYMMYYDKVLLDSRIVKITQNASDYTVGTPFQLTPNNVASLGQIIRVEENKFMLLYSTPSDHELYPSKKAVWTLLTENDTFQLGDPEPLEGNTAVTVYKGLAPISSTVSVICYSGTRTRKINVGQGEPATGIVLSKSCLDSDGISKAAYVHL